MSLPLLRGERLNKIYTCVSTTCEAYTVGGQPHSPSVYTLHRNYFNSNPNLVHMHKSRGDNVQQISRAIGQMGTKRGVRTIPPEPGFFVQYRPKTRPLCQLPNGPFFQIRPRRNVSKGFSIFLVRGHLPSKTSKLKMSNKYLPLTRIVQDAL